MEIVADLHTHSLLCRHAYSTVTEVIQAAADKGLAGIGLTEHGPGYPGSVNYAYFNTYRDIPRQMKGLQIYCGAEANLMDFTGKLDFTDEQLKKLDLVIASCHVECSPRGSIEENTKMFLGAISNRYVDIIGHPDNPLYPVDIDTLAKAAAENNTALEINNSSPAARPGSEAICRDIIIAAKRYGTKLSVGSDAHYHLVVGNFDYALDRLTEMDFPMELVINTSMQKLNDFLAVHHKRRVTQANI